jgi:DNA-binding MarR family transcriptional regulator
MARKDVPLDPILDFMRLLWSVEHGLHSTSKRMGSRIGITGPQRLVLRMVTRCPGISAGELAQVVQLHPSTLTGIIQRLVAKKLLIRERDHNDTRFIRLRAARRARRFTVRSRGTIESAVQSALAGVPAGDVRRARRVLRAVADALNRKG